MTTDHGGMKAGSPRWTSHWRPLSVSLYFCKRLLGLSGMVISIRPSASAGLR